MNWQYKDGDLTEVPSDAYGFIYMIKYTNGKVYYGKKNFFSETTIAALKNGKRRPDAERITKLKRKTPEEMKARTHIQKKNNVRFNRVPFDIIRKESKWQAYKGSSEDTKDLEIEYKEILALAVSKRELTYLEAKCLFQMEALEDPACLNKNIGALFYRDNLE